jgi:hypothetical protein
MSGSTTVSSGDGDRDSGPSASGMLLALQREQVTHCVTVPDFVQFALHQRIMGQACGIANVMACTEIKP